MNLKMPVFFDTDCLCSFSWVNRLDILIKLFGNNVCIPSLVFREIERLRYTKSSFVYQNIKRKIETGEFKLIKLEPLHTLYTEFLELVDPVKKSRSEMGKLQQSFLLNNTMVPLPATISKMCCRIFNKTTHH